MYYLSRVFIEIIFSLNYDVEILINTKKKSKLYKYSIWAMTTIKLILKVTHLPLIIIIIDCMFRILDILFSVVNFGSRIQN